MECEFLIKVSFFSQNYVQNCIVFDFTALPVVVFEVRLRFMKTYLFEVVYGVLTKISGKYKGLTPPKV